MNNKIEFIEGEPYCRYNGVLMNEEGCIKTFGYNEDLCMLDDVTVCIENKIYSEHDISEIIKLLSSYNNTTPEWDIIYNGDPEPSSVTLRRKLDDTYVIRADDLEVFDKVRRISPLKRLKKDYPNISIKKYMDYKDALDNYYTQLI